MFKTKIPSVQDVYTTMSHCRYKTTRNALRIDNDELFLQAANVIEHLLVIAGEDRIRLAAERVALMDQVARLKTSGA